MKALVVSLGKVRESWVKEACAEYSKRLQAWMPTERLELRDASQLAKAIPPRYITWALDEHGYMMNSHQLAVQLNNIRHSYAGWALIIGGPDGLPAPIKQGASLLWSLSALTFPFQLTHVLVFEQLYRAVSLLHNTPYHRE